MWICRSAFHIKSSAFWFCSSLTDVTIPSTVTSLEFYAFYGCPALKHATFRGNAPVMASVVFSSVPAAFEIRYFQNRTGFSTPIWLGFKTKNLGVLFEAPAEILVQAPSGGDMADHANTEDFGSLELGEPTTRVFTIRNAGEVPLTDLAATCDGSNAADFSVGFPAAASLSPGGFTTITVTFQATAGGDREARLRIFSSDADENPYRNRNDRQRQGPRAGDRHQPARGQRSGGWEGEEELRHSGGWKNRQCQNLHHHQ